MFCFLSSNILRKRTAGSFAKNTGTSIVSLIVDYYGSYSCIVTGVMVACLPEKIGSQKNYRCLAGGIGGVVITEIYCAVIVHIKGMASSELFENILSGDSLVVRIIPALLAGVVMSRIITRLPGLDISCPETDSLS